MPVVLDVGCGNRKKPGAIGIDFNPDTQADVIHDLNKFPYPFDTSFFDIIIADNVIEHLDDVVKVVEELHRISKPHGQLIITVPYFRSKWAFIDPTHKHFFTSESFSYFDVNHIHHDLYSYSKIRTRINHIVFNENIRHSGITKITSGIFARIANRFPNWYDAHLGHIFPLDTLTFHLEILK
ncbi:MAG: class I SAM-dependent methyltransferase [Methanomicrobiales archaeon]|jgi:SAM-dependent methyltransferase|nr:class I SAM-dependent methyltransferase [Methanomicrobiales archaeon]